MNKSDPRFLKLSRIFQKLDNILVKSQPSFKSRSLPKYLLYDHALFMVFRVTEGAILRNLFFSFSKIIDKVILRKVLKRLLENLNLCINVKKFIIQKRYFYRWKTGNFVIDLTKMDINTVTKFLSRRINNMQKDRIGITFDILKNQRKKLLKNQRKTDLFIENFINLIEKMKLKRKLIGFFKIENFASEKKEKLKKLIKILKKQTKKNLKENFNQLKINLINEQEGFDRIDSLFKYIREKYRCIGYYKIIYRVNLEKKSKLLCILQKIFVLNKKKCLFQGFENLKEIKNNENKFNEAILNELKKKKILKIFLCFKNNVNFQKNKLKKLGSIFDKINKNNQELVEAAFNEIKSRKEKDKKNGVKADNFLNEKNKKILIEIIRILKKNVEINKKRRIFLLKIMDLITMKNNILVKEGFDKLKFQLISAKKSKENQLKLDEYLNNNNKKLLFESYQKIKQNFLLIRLQKQKLSKILEDINNIKMSNIGYALEKMKNSSENIKRAEKKQKKLQRNSKITNNSLIFTDLFDKMRLKNLEYSFLKIRLFSNNQKKIIEINQNRKTLLLNIIDLITKKNNILVKEGFDKLRFKYISGKKSKENELKLDEYLNINNHKLLFKSYQKIKQNILLKKLQKQILSKILKDINNIKMSNLGYALEKMKNNSENIKRAEKKQKKLQRNSKITNNSLIFADNFDKMRIRNLEYSFLKIKLFFDNQKKIIEINEKRKTVLLNIMDLITIKNNFLIKNVFDKLKFKLISSKKSKENQLKLDEYLNNNNHNLLFESYQKIKQNILLKKLQKQKLSKILDDINNIQKSNLGYALEKMKNNSENIKRAEKKQKTLQRNSKITNNSLIFEDKFDEMRLKNLEYSFSKIQLFSDYQKFNSILGVLFKSICQNQLKLNFLKFKKILSEKALIEKLKNFWENYHKKLFLKKLELNLQKQNEIKISILNLIDFFNRKITKNKQYSLKKFKNFSECMHNKLKKIDFSSKLIDFTIKNLINERKNYFLIKLKERNLKLKKIAEKLNKLRKINENIKLRSFLMGFYKLKNHDKKNLSLQKLISIFKKKKLEFSLQFIENLKINNENKLNEIINDKKIDNFKFLNLKKILLIWKSLTKTKKLANENFKNLLLKKSLKKYYDILKNNFENSKKINQKLNEFLNFLDRKMFLIKYESFENINEYAKNNEKKLKMCVFDKIQQKYNILLSDSFFRLKSNIIYKNNLVKLLKISSNIFLKNTYKLKLHAFYNLKLMKPTIKNSINAGLKILSLFYQIRLNQYFSKIRSNNQLKIGNNNNRKINNTAFNFSENLIKRLKKTLLRSAWSKLSERRYYIGLSTIKRDKNKQNTNYLTNELLNTNDESMPLSRVDDLIAKSRAKIKNVYDTVLHEKKSFLTEFNVDEFSDNLDELAETLRKQLEDRASKAKLLEINGNNETCDCDICGKDLDWLDKIERLNTSEDRFIEMDTHVYRKFLRIPLKTVITSPVSPILRRIIDRRLDLY